MEVRVIASSHIGHEAEKQKFDEFSGKMLGLINKSDNLKTLMYEDNAKALRRSDMAKVNRDRSVFDHENITLYFEDLPKIISVILDSEKSWRKSEKDNKFTSTYFSKEEELIYNKWVDLFKGRIAKGFKDKNQVCTDKMLENLAEGYAIYLKSVFTPITATYTVSYGEYNRVIGVLENYIGKEKNNDFENKLSATLIEFVMKLKALVYYDKNLAKTSDQIKLFTKNNIEEYYGDVYSTSYKGSFECVSKLIQNRDINYQINLLEGEYYAPSIISENSDLKELWNSDIITLGNYPLATLFTINERGNLDDFILKYTKVKKEELLTEKTDVIKDVYNKYEYSLRLKMHKRAEELINLK